MKTAEQIQDHLNRVRQQRQFFEAESRKPDVTAEHSQKHSQIAQLRWAEEVSLLWVLDREVKIPPVWGMAGGCKSRTSGW